MVTREEIRLRILELAGLLLTSPEIVLGPNQDLASFVEDLAGYVFADLPREDAEDE